MDIRELKAEKPRSTCYEKYQGEMLEYMQLKLASFNVPKTVIMEIAQYTMTGTLLVAQDEVRRAYRDFNKHIRRRG